MGTSLPVRIIRFLVIAQLVFNGIWWLVIPIALYLMLQHDAYEYIFLAWCIDVYFAPTPFTFWYTFMTTAAVVLIGYLRPYLRWRPFQAE